MRNWAILIAVVYGFILAVLLAPLWAAAFWPPIGSPATDLSFFKDLFKNVYGMAFMWFGIGILVLAQAVLLLVQVRLENKRPISKSSIISLVTVTSLMFAFLLWGALFSIHEIIFKDHGVLFFTGDQPTFLDEISAKAYYFIWAVSVAMWLFWGVVFYRLSKKSEPRPFIEKQCRLLFRGSILELLIAVPAHIIARHRDYCCAGYQTFFGIAFGVAVAIFSFGPGVFFLFAERLKHLQRKDQRKREGEL